MQNTIEDNTIPFLRPYLSANGNVRREPKKVPAWNVDTMFPALGYFSFPFFFSSHIRRGGEIPTSKSIANMLALNIKAEIALEGRYRC